MELEYKGLEKGKFRVIDSEVVVLVLRMNELCKEVTA